MWNMLENILVVYAVITSSYALFGVLMMINKDDTKKLKKIAKKQIEIINEDLKALDKVDTSSEKEEVLLLYLKTKIMHDKEVWEDLIVEIEE